MYDLKRMIFKQWYMALKHSKTWNALSKCPVTGKTGKKLKIFLNNHENWHILVCRFSVWKISATQSMLVFIFLRHFEKQSGNNFLSSSNVRLWFGSHKILLIFDLNSISNCLLKERFWGYSEFNSKDWSKNRYCCC